MIRNKKSAYEREYAKYKTKIEEKLSEICGGLKNMPQILIDGIKYALLDGGKRLRPTLCLATIKMLGGVINDKSIKLSTILEIIHCYSLVHDDLPCMDDDDYRRNKPSTHKQFGEAMGVLIGDAMLNLSYEIGLAMVGQSKTITAALQCIATNAGGLGIIGGQVEDIMLDEHQDHTNLDVIYIQKTASLFCASLVSAALFVGSDSNTVSYLDQLGKHLGIAFQIKDDLDEYYNGGTSQKSQSKITIVSAYGDTKAKEILNSHLSQANQVLQNLSQYDISFLQTTLNQLTIDPIS